MGALVNMRKKPDFGRLLEVLGDPRTRPTTSRMTPPRRLPLGEQLELDEAADAAAAMAIATRGKPVQTCLRFDATSEPSGPASAGEGHVDGIAVMDIGPRLSGPFEL